MGVVTERRDRSPRREARLQAEVDVAIANHGRTIRVVLRGTVCNASTDGVCVRVRADDQFLEGLRSESITITCKPEETAIALRGRIKWFTRLPRETTHLGVEVAWAAVDADSRDGYAAWLSTLEL